MSNLIEAEVTVTKVWPPKPNSNYGAINCAELKTEQNKYGRVSVPANLVRKFQENRIYKIMYHETEEGYLNFDCIVTDKDPPKVAPRPPTNPTDSDRMGRQGMVNNILGSIEGMTLSDWLNVDAKHIAALITKCAQALDIAEKVLKETKSHNPVDVHTGTRKQKSEEFNDEIPTS